MHTSRFFLLFLLFASLSVVLPAIHAQSTSISELSYPPGISPDNLDPISVIATVSYKDAQPGYLLVVGILDVDRYPSSPIPGVAMSSPDECLNQPILSAYCLTRTSGSSGLEHLEFKIGGILGDQLPEGNWNLNMTAALYNANNTLVASSVSSVPFTISVSPIILTVIVPGKAVVWVDGVKQQPGSIEIPISAGQHNVTVPGIVDVEESTRLRFDHWTDSITQPNRTININLSESLEAVYVTQYRLSIAGQGASTAGEGWYDSGYTATFSVAETEQMSGLLGLLGGRRTFQAWYENNELLTDSPIDHIIMNKPHTLTVNWQENYTMPIVIIGLLAGIGIVLGYMIMRRRANTAARELASPSQRVVRTERKRHSVRIRASRRAKKSPSKVRRRPSR